MLRCGFCELDITPFAQSHMHGMFEERLMIDFHANPYTHTYGDAHSYTDADSHTYSNADSDTQSYADSESDAASYL